MSGVLIVVEQQRERTLTRLSLEALAAGQRLAKQLGIDCAAVVLGEGIAPVVRGELAGRSRQRYLRSSIRCCGSTRRMGIFMRWNRWSTERTGLCDSSA